jgi:hypothetical protein
MHPVDAPFAVYHFHHRRSALTNMGIAGLTMAVGPRMIVLNQKDFTAKIWLLDPAKSNSK